MDVTQICSKAKDILGFAGWALTIFKIAIPLLILAFGMFDFGKAVTAGKDDEIKKSAKSLMIRAIAGVIIFFVPTIVMWLFSGISSYSKAAEQGDFCRCKVCILKPWNCAKEDACAEEEDE